MDAWPPSSGEALHTQTFLGHPPGCAAALAALAVIDDEKLAGRAAELGASALGFLREALAAQPRVVECRGLGLLIGIECDAPATAQRACASALARGVIALPSGDDGRVIAVTPPLVIGRDALLSALAVLVESLA
jgi:4-aminobutyrate aminotransferase/(S)-3-amino-2-methylpropionate transaminase